MVDYKTPAAILSEEELRERIENLSPENLEFLFVAMSSKQQDEFLEEIKKHMDEKDWQTLIIHLMSYEMMLSDAKEKTARMRDGMALMLFEQLKEEGEIKNPF